MGSLACNGIVRITRDAEVRKTSSGSWLNFGIAAFRKNTKEGKQDVDFFDADVYCKDYVAGAEKKFSKGTLIYIENAYLRNDQFKGTDGKEKSKFKLLINAYEILNSKSSETKTTSKPQATHPSDLPPPIVTPATPKKSELDPAGQRYYEDLQKKKDVEALKKDKLVEPEFEPDDDWPTEPPF